MNSPERPRKQEKKFILFFLLSALFFLVLVILANVIINPRSEFSTHIFRPLIKEARAEKIDLLAAFKEKPEIIILGSSNAMMLNNSLIKELTNETSFNAAVDAARIEDYYAMLRYIMEDMHIKPKKLIIALNIEAFNNNLEVDPRLIAEKRLYSKIAQPIISPKINIIISSLNPYYIQDDLTVLRYSLTGYPANFSHVTPDGSVIYDKWNQEKLLGTFNLDAEINNSLNSFVARFRYMTNLSPERKQYLEDILSIAKANNIAVLMFIPMISPKGLEFVKAETKYEEMHQDLLKYIDSLKQKYDFVFVDTSEAGFYNADPNGFYDVAHVDQGNADLIVRVLLS